MYIEYTFKVNAFSVEKGVISVTYIPVDTTLELPVHHIQQLGVNKQDMVDYSKGIIDADEFKIRLRKAIVDASTLPIYEWNQVLDARGLVVPVEVEAMLGVEWPVVAESEVASNTLEVL
jgi:hypothetical protein